MTNEQQIARMWEAYKAGMNVPGPGIIDNPYPYRDKFLHWIKEHYPELLETTTYKHFDIMCKCDELTPYDKEKGCCCYD